MNNKTNDMGVSLVAIAGSLHQSSGGRYRDKTHPHIICFVIHNVLPKSVAIFASEEVALTFPSSTLDFIPYVCITRNPTYIR
jgi:Mg2+/Co2+ transporter CorB